MRTRLFREGESLHAPYPLDLEIVHAFAPLLPDRRTEARSCGEALAYLGDLPMVRDHHEPYVPRIWQLRHSLMAYDAGVGGARRSARILGHHARWALSLGSRHRAKIELVKWRALVA